MKISKAALWLIAIVLVFLVLFPRHVADVKAFADTSRFDHIAVVSPLFLYQGKQGLLLIDKRNGNIWFLAKEADELKLKYGEPVLLARIPFEKLDQVP